MGPFIDITGLKRGKRLKKLSDEARLFYPLLLCSSNSFGRFEIDYDTMYREILSAFRCPIQENRFYEMLLEYRDADLLFLYENSGQHWGQWQVKKTKLPKYHSEEDEASPKPPDPEFSQWLARIESSSDGSSRVLSDFPNISGNVSEGFRNCSARVEVEVEFEREESRARVEAEETRADATVATSNVVQMQARRPPGVAATVQTSSFPVAVNGGCVSVPLAPAISSSNTSPSPPIADAAFELQVEAVYALHPKKTFKSEGIRAVIRRYKGRPEQFESFKKNHELWRKTRNWSKEDGRFAPPLYEVIANDVCLSPPPSAIPTIESAADYFEVPVLT